MGLDLQVMPIKLYTVPKISRFHGWHLVILYIHINYSYMYSMDVDFFVIMLYIKNTTHVSSTVLTAVLCDPLLL
jgi:hypothetical protein